MKNAAVEELLSAGAFDRVRRRHEIMVEVQDGQGRVAQRSWILAAMRLRTHTHRG